MLRDLTVYYQPQNQRPRVTEITVGDEADRASASRRLARGGKPRSPVVKLRWHVDNPDDDELIYRLYLSRGERDQLEADRRRRAA